MVHDQDSILYASVSKGTTVLADFVSGVGDGDTESLASQCLEHAPLFHLIYSHATGKRIYCFLMDDPFVYFAIVDEGLGKPQSFVFLDCVKDAFTKIVKNRPIDVPDHLATRCFSEEFGPILRSLIYQSQSPEIAVTVAATTPRELSPSVNLDRLLSGKKLDAVAARDVRNGTLHATATGKKFVSTEAPLLGKPNKSEKRSMSEEQIREVIKGVRAFSINNEVDVPADANVCRECAVPLNKNNIYRANVEPPQRQRVWKRHLRIVLFADVLVCCLMFGIWLSICKGFQCISSS